MKSVTTLLSLSTSLLLAFSSFGDVTNGLVLYYSCDTDEGGVVSDLSGNGNSGVVSGATWTASGASSGAYEFVRAEQDYISASNSPSLNITTAITVSAWIRIQPSTTHERIVAKYYYSTTNGNGGYALQLSNTGVPQFTLATDAGMHRDGSTALDDGEWHHLAATYDGSNIVLYADGHVDPIGVVAGPMPSSIKPTVEPLLVGKTIFNGTHYYADGAIDEVRVYNRALSSNEVWELYSPPTSGLVLYYSFDADEGTNVVDQSTYGNHGIPSGAVWTTNGLSGGGFYFDGTNDYIQLFDSPSLRPTNLTISLWVKPSTAIDTNMDV
ncbi:MAG: LamG domain-containing protein, partial [Verrucomicrobia bacterium]|nr:LamG domain-containing protein [Verrucomicrobiota bacterium]